MDRHLIVTSPPVDLETSGGPCPEVTVRTELMSGQALRSAIGTAFRLVLQYRAPVTVAGMAGRAVVFCADRTCEHVTWPLRVLPALHVAELAANGTAPEGRWLRHGGHSALVVGAPDRAWK